MIFYFNYQRNKILPLLEILSLKNFLSFSVLKLCFKNLILVIVTTTLKLVPCSSYLSAPDSMKGSKLGTATQKKALGVTAKITIQTNAYKEETI